MSIPVNATYDISDKALNIFITNARGSQVLGINYTWTTVSFVQY